MFNRSYTILILFIIMFSFFDKVEAKYEKIFFDLNIKSINGDDLNLNQFKGKIILLVNVASNCGFTKQYTDLQNLYEQYKDKGLIVIGVPSNQFGGQEPGSNKEIKEFCETTFGIDFPISEKMSVVGSEAHPFFFMG